MAGQENEDIEFLRTEPQFFATQGHGSPGTVDLEVAGFDHLSQGNTLFGSASLRRSFRTLGK
jgi:hypothetical protein